MPTPNELTAWPPNGESSWTAWAPPATLNGGDEGGYIIAEGPPEEIAKKNLGYTSVYLKKSLSF